MSCCCQVYDQAAVMIYINQEQFSMSSLICELIKRARDKIVMCIEWSIVLPWHFVYSDLWETCLLFSINTAFTSHRCQSSVLTWLTGTMGVFCFCRVSLMCKAVQNKSIQEEEFWPLPQLVSPPSSDSDHWVARADGQQRPATGVITSHPSLPPSLKQWSHSLYQESADCLKCLPLCLTERYFFFLIDPEDGQREVGDNKTTLDWNWFHLAPYNYCFKLQSVTVRSHFNSAKLREWRWCAEGRMCKKYDTWCLSLIIINN